MPTLQKQPKYFRLAGHLREKIQSGLLEPGARLPSVAQMKAQHGVSLTTVDRAQALLEQEGFIVREHGRGTFVAQPALRERTGLIGLIGRTFEGRRTSFDVERITSGIEEALYDNEKRLVLLDAQSSLGWDGVDGILICRPSQTQENVAQLPDQVPCVSLLESVAGISSVEADEAHACRLAVEHLVALGHRRIAFLMQENSLVRRTRWAAYRQALCDAGIAPREEWLRADTLPIRHIGDYTRLGREGMAAWLQDGWRETGCTALIAQNDTIAIGAMKSLQAAGVCVPDDVSVLGFDATELTQTVSPALTSVEIPFKQIGQAGVELLLRRIETSRIEPEHIVLPTRLQARASTAAKRH